MKKTVLITMFLVSSVLARLQPNVISVEILGSGGIYSLNYERFILNIKDTHVLSLRGGFSYVPVNSPTVDNVVTLPVTLSYFIGRGKIKGEIGGGITAHIVDKNDGLEYQITPAFIAGCRIIQPGSGSSVRIAFTPLKFKDFMFWFGIALGRSF